MNTLSYRTISANQDIIKKEWILIDAEDQVLGRLASEVAKMLRGKNKTYFTPHADCGDYVIVVNAEKVKLSGNKWDAKHYLHTAVIRAVTKLSTPRELRAKKPTAMVEEASGACSQRLASDARSSKPACLCRYRTSTPGSTTQRSET